MGDSHRIWILGFAGEGCSVFGRRSLLGIIEWYLVHGLKEFWGVLDVSGPSYSTQSDHFLQWRGELA